GGRPRPARRRRGGAPLRPGRLPRGLRLGLAAPLRRQGRDRRVHRRAAGRLRGTRGPGDAPARRIQVPGARGGLKPMAFEQTLVQIRERSFLEVHDLALVVLRNEPRALGLAALAGIAPFAALNAWLTSDPEFPLQLFVVLVLLEVPWATAPLTAVLGSRMFGQRLSARQLLGRLWQALPSLVVYQF